MNLLLNTIKSYVPLQAADEEIIGELFHQRHFPKGGHLLTAGSICRHITLIETGLVRYYITRDGEERTIYFNKEGEFVCDYTSYLPQRPSQVNIQALEDTTVWMIGISDMAQFYEKVTHGERFGRLGIEEVFVSVSLQMASLYTDPPETRYRKFLDNYPGIVQRIPQYYIASYVGVKPQSLSRIRKRIVGTH